MSRIDELKAQLAAAILESPDPAKAAAEMRNTITVTSKVAKANPADEYFKAGVVKYGWKSMHDAWRSHRKIYNPVKMAKPSQAEETLRKLGGRIGISS
jgi:hypothetical protein